MGDRPCRHCGIGVRFERLSQREPERLRVCHGRPGRKATELHPVSGIQLCRLAEGGLRCELVVRRRRRRRVPK